MRVRGFISKLDSRYRVLVVATGIYNWAMALPSSYAQLYAALLGLSPIELGALSSASNLAGVFASFPAGWLIARYGLRKTLIVGFLVYMASASAYAVASSGKSLVPAAVLAAVSPALVFPVADMVIIEVIGRGARATAIGLSRVVWNLFSLAAPPIATLVVASLGGIATQSIRHLFVLQFAAVAAATLLLFAGFREKGPRSGSRTSVRDALSGLRLLSDKASAAWIVAMATQRFSMAFAFSFIPLWLVEVRGADEYVLGAMNSAGLAALVAFAALAGALADRKGWLKVFLALRPLLYVGTMVALAFPGREALLAAGALGMVGYMYGAGASSFVPFIAAFWEAAPADRRGAWYTVSSLLGGIAATAAPMIGGALWELGYYELVLLLPLAVDTAGLAAAVAAASWGGGEASKLRAGV